MLLLVGAATILAYDLFQVLRVKRDTVEEGAIVPAVKPARWRTAMKLALCAAAPVLVALSIVVIPSGWAGVRVSQLSGPKPGTLGAGAHVVTPLVDSVALYSLKDTVLATEGGEKQRPEALKAQTSEGLNVGLAVSVRYRLDAGQLYRIHTTLPEEIGGEVVAPVVASVWRETTPGYGIRELFAAKRDEARRAAAERITKRLAADGIVVREVILKDVQLPPEYARGLEAMLLKEQENERLTVELQAKEKQVKVDLMEANSQKEITIRQAEGAAQAKLLDSNAEMERQKRLAEAEEVRIRRVANANSEKMRLEAEVLKQNPMLIQKIIAERLSDKVQIMMIPADVKNFFATDVLRGVMTGHGAQ